ncbi:MAG: hypothetical protein HOQ24_11240, partial [Mycobacteriaceae bacterium]|nr:hypothetical protein [Mycobacteriaceae bacterium]
TVGVTTGADVRSMSCGDLPLLPGEAGAVAAASESYAAGSESNDVGQGGNPPYAGDGVSLRATYYRPETVNAVFVAVLQRVQACPNRQVDPLRYVVPVPTSGDDPGPPHPPGARYSSGLTRLDLVHGNRLAWRGLVPDGASPIGSAEHATCLLDRTGVLVIRSCGMSLDSRRADALALSGLAALQGR